MCISIFLSKFLSFFSHTFISPEVSSSKPAENKIFYCHQSSIHAYIDWGFMSTVNSFHESLWTTIHLLTTPPNPRPNPAKKYHQCSFKGIFMLTLYNHIPKVLRFKQMCIGMQTFRRHETHPYFSPKQYNGRYNWKKMVQLYHTRAVYLHKLMWMLVFFLTGSKTNLFYF